MPVYPIARADGEIGQQPVHSLVVGFAGYFQFGRSGGYQAGTQILRLLDAGIKAIGKYPCAIGEDALQRVAQQTGGQSEPVWLPMTVFTFVGPIWAWVHICWS